MSAGNTVLILLGVGLLAGALVYGQISTDSINATRSSCYNAASTTYQQEQNSNPYSPGTAEYDEWMDDALNEYQDSVAACSTTATNNLEQANSSTDLGVIVGAILLGAGLYRRSMQPPMTSPVPPGAVVPPSSENNTTEVGPAR